MSRRPIKTINIRFYDMDGHVQVTPMTMDWGLVEHNATIDLCPLMEKLKENVPSKNCIFVGE